MASSKRHFFPKSANHQVDIYLTWDWIITSYFNYSKSLCFIVNTRSTVNVFLATIKAKDLSAAKKNVDKQVNIMKQ